MKIPMAIVMLLLSAWLSAAQAADGMNSSARDYPADACRIYDGTLYSGKPAVREGVLDIHVAYEGDLWNPRLPDAPMPWRRRVELAAETAAARDVPLVLDIERWHVDERASDAEVESSVAKLVEIIGWARQAAPEVRMGYFSLAPMAAVAWALAPEGSSENLAWRRVNDRLRPLVEAVDIVFPHAYTYRNNPGEWQAYAISNIEEARRYGKSVYLFIWPQYTERNQELGYTYLPTEFWQRQLSVSCEHADGVVLWGGWDPVNNRRAIWDESAQWWQDVLNYQAQ